MTTYGVYDDCEVSLFFAQMVSVRTLPTLDAGRYYVVVQGLASGASRFMWRLDDDLPTVPVVPQRL